MKISPKLSWPGTCSSVGRSSWLKDCVLQSWVAFLLFTGLTQANPTGEQIAAGNASFDRNGSTLTITQGSGTAIINWQDFSIGSGELTKFIQPSAASAVLNRVISGNPSSLLGSLQANGSVYLINPNGILVGPGANINVNAFTASTLDIPDSLFLQGGDRTFSGNSGASIVNLGKIEALGGDVVLMARDVQNHGEIKAAHGTVALGGAGQVLVSTTGANRITVGVDAGTVNNTGTIDAVKAELQAVGGNIYALAVNNGGSIRATGVVNENGRILLKALGGTTQNTGTLAAHNADGSGGKVEVIGQRVALAGNSLINTSATTAGKSGGEVLVGGDTHGANPEVMNAEQTYVDSGTQIKADGNGTGNGGKVVVWADRTTQYYGDISGQGGNDGGNGGFAEVSGKEFLDFLGTVDLRALNGETGTLLLDPTDIELVAGTGSHVGGSFVSYAWSPTGATSTIYIGTSAADANTLLNLLNTANVTITTASSYGGVGNITFTGDMDWATVTRAGASLTLKASNDITINGKIYTSSPVSGKYITLDFEANQTVGANAASGTGVLSINNSIDALGTTVINGGVFTARGNDIVVASGAAIKAGGINYTASRNLTIGSDLTASNGNFVLGAAGASYDGTGTLMINGATPLVFTTGTGNVTLTSGKGVGASPRSSIGIGSNVGDSFSLVPSTGVFGTLAIQGFEDLRIDQAIASTSSLTFTANQMEVNGNLTSGPSSQISLYAAAFGGVGVNNAVRNLSGANTLQGLITFGGATPPVIQGGNSQVILSSGKGASNRESISIGAGAGDDFYLIGGANGLGSLNLQGFETVTLNQDLYVSSLAGNYVLIYANQIDVNGNITTGSTGSITMYAAAFGGLGGNGNYSGSSYQTRAGIINFGLTSGGVAPVLAAGTGGLTLFSGMGTSARESISIGPGVGNDFSLVTTSGASALGSVNLKGFDSVTLNQAISANASAGNLFIVYANQINVNESLASGTTGYLELIGGVYGGLGGNANTEDLSGWKTKIGALNFGSNPITLTSGSGGSYDLGFFLYSGMLNVAGDRPDMPSTVSLAYADTTTNGTTDTTKGWYELRVTGFNDLNFTVSNAVDGYAAGDVFANLGVYLGANHLTMDENYFTPHMGLYGQATNGWIKQTAGIVNVTDSLVFRGLGLVELNSAGNIAAKVGAWMTDPSANVFFTSAAGINLSSLNGLSPTPWGNINTTGMNVGGNITLVSDSFTINGNLNAPGSISLMPYTASKSIGLYGAAGDLAFNSAALANITGTSLLTFGRQDGTGAITVATGYSSARNLKLLSGGAGGSISTQGTLAAAGNVSITLEAPTITTASTVTTTGTGDITLTSNSLNLGGNLSAGRNVIFQASHASDTVGVASTGSYDLALTSALLNQTSAGTGIIIGRTDGSGAMEVGTYTFPKAVTFRTGAAGGTITVLGNVLNSAGNLTVNAYDDLSVLGGSLRATGTLGIASVGGDILISSDAGVGGQPLSSIAASYTISGNHGFTFQAGSVGKTLGINASGQDIAISSIFSKVLTANFQTLTFGRADSTAGVAVGGFTSPTAAVNILGGTINLTGDLTAPRLFLQTGGNFTLGSTSHLNATGTGTDLILVVGGDFTASNSASVNPGTGRYLIYLNQLSNAKFSGTFASTGNLFNRTYSAGDPALIDANPLLNGNRIVYIYQPTLTFTAQDATKTYGDLNPAFSIGAITGLIAGDSSASLSGALSTTATQWSNAGNYAITAGTLASNLGYALSVTPGTLTIDPSSLAITVTAQNANKTYGDVNPPFSFTATPGLSGDPNALFTTDPTYTSTATQWSNVGSYAITTSGGTSLNYSNITYVDGSLAIDPASLTITVQDATKNFGDPNPAFTYTHDALVGDPNPLFTTSPTLTTTATQSSPVAGSPYAITASGAVAPNYTVSYIPGLLTILAGSSGNGGGGGGGNGGGNGSGTDLSQDQPSLTQMNNAWDTSHPWSDVPGSVETANYLGTSRVENSFQIDPTLTLPSTGYLYHASSLQDMVARGNARWWDIPSDNASSEDPAQPKKKRAILSID